MWETVRQILRETLRIEFSLNIDGFSFVLHSWPLLKFLASWGDIIKSGLEAIIFITDQILEGETGFVYEIRPKLEKLKNVIYQLLYIAHPLTYRRTSSTLAILKNVIRADVMTTCNSFFFWIPKFRANKSMEEILCKCPYNACPSCRQPFLDIVMEGSNSGDVAVLPGCDHLYCLQCLQNNTFDATWVSIGISLFKINYKM